MNHLKPYPAYRDSGVPWLGDVPEHWDIRSLGSLTRPLNQRCRPNLPLLSVVREKGVILRSTMSDEENHNYVPDDLSNYKVVRKGNLVINKMKAWQGSMGIASQDGIVSPAYFVYDLQMADLNFGHSLLRSKPYVALFGRVSDGVRVGQWDLSPAGMKRIPIVIPSLPEQTAIVRYLDYMDRHIRRFINAKQKLIALLNEQKQALIHQAVTRGLDPNVRLKPSGVEWLGDIPKHWEVQRLRNIVRMLVSNIDKHTKEDEASIRLCNYVDVYKNERITEHLSFMPASASAEEIARFILKPGDIIITKDSEAWNDIGVPSLVEYSAPDLVCGYHLAILRPRVGILGEYLLRALQSPSIASQFYVAANGVTRYGLSHVAIKGVSVPIPPLPEQTAIVQFLNDAIANFDAATNRAQHEITLLREYRIRLIADVVIGKLDVREAAAKLPEETEEEPFEEIEEAELLNDNETAVENDEEALTMVTDDD